MTAGGPAGGTLSDSALVEQATRLVCGSAPASLTPGHAFRLLLDARLIDRSGRPTAALDTLQHAHDATGASAGLLPSLPMLLGHALAAAAVGWLLRRGDLAVLRLIELSAHGVAEGSLVRSLRAALALARALCAGLLPAPGPGPRRPRADRDEAPAPHTAVLQHTVIRRGPPAAAFLLRRLTRPPPPPRTRAPVCRRRAACARARVFLLTTGPHSEWSASFHEGFPYRRRRCRRGYGRPRAVRPRVRARHRAAGGHRRQGRLRGRRLQGAERARRRLDHQAGGDPSPPATRSPP